MTGIPLAVRKRRPAKPRAPKITETQGVKNCVICDMPIHKPYKYSVTQWASRRTCGVKCQSKLPHGRSPRPLMERFEEKYTPEPNSGCWLWLGACNRDRYGCETYGVIGTTPRGTSLAHRIAWLLYRGPIPTGLILLHRCDNQQCVNPDHLRLGTYADNNADMVAKGRHGGGGGKRRRERPVKP